MTAFGPGGLNCTGLLNAPLMINPTFDHDAILVAAMVDTADILPFDNTPDADSQPDPTPGFTFTPTDQAVTGSDASSIHILSSILLGVIVLLVW